MTTDSQQTNGSNALGRLLNGKAIIALLLAVTLFGSVFGGFVMGQGDVTEDFLCEDEDQEFVQNISQLVAILVFGGPIAGTLVFVGYKAAESARPSKYNGSDGKKALIAGWATPFILYGLQLALSLVFGLDIGCITP